MKTAVRTLKSQAGFSLIELMIVVAIIGILASIAVPNFQKFQRKAKQTEGKGYLSNIYSAEKSFQAEWSTYNADLTCVGFKIDGRGVYGAGFSQAGVATVGTTCVTTAANSFAVPPQITGGITAPAVGDLPTTVMSATAFTAGTAGNITGAAVTDKWTMDDGKLIVNTASGL